METTASDMMHAGKTSVLYINTDSHIIINTGEITPVQRHAVSNINGHSGKTTQDYYVLQERHKDVQNGITMFDQLVSTDLASIWDDSVQFENYPVPDITSKQWGTDHPSYDSSNSNPRRVIWSSAEINYIKNWMQKEFNREPKETRVKRCLQHIKSDDGATAVFHLNHILNSGKLRCGFDNFYKAFEQWDRRLK